LLNNQLLAVDSKLTRLINLVTLIPWTLGPFNVYILLNGWICLQSVLVSRLFFSNALTVKVMHFYAFHSFIYNIEYEMPCPF